MNPICFSGHAVARLSQRGGTQAEVEDAIHNEIWQAAKSGRYECRKEFPYKADWNGRYYANKQVRPVFIDNSIEIVVITVYVYYY